MESAFVDASSECRACSTQSHMRPSARQTSTASTSHIACRSRQVQRTATAWTTIPWWYCATSRILFKANNMQGKRSINCEMIRIGRLVMWTGKSVVLEPQGKRRRKENTSTLKDFHPMESDKETSPRFTLKFMGKPREWERENSRV